MNTKTFIIVLLIALGLFIGYWYGAEVNNGEKNNNQNQIETALPVEIPVDGEITTTTVETPLTCVDETEGQPVITNLEPTSGSVGTEITLRGCNFRGFEGDLLAFIENSSGTKGVVTGKPVDNGGTITFVLEDKFCQTDNSYTGWDCEAWLELTPGEYKIYTMPWGKKSNEVMFTIQ